MPVGKCVIKGWFHPRGDEKIRASGAKIFSETLVKDGNQRITCVVVRGGERIILGPEVEVSSIILQ